MTSTGLQQYISSCKLDATRTYMTEISIYSPDPSVGVIETSEVIEASVEGVTEIAEETLTGSHADSIMTFKFPRTEDSIECFRVEGQIVCRKPQIYRV